MKASLLLAGVFAVAAFGAAAQQVSPIEIVDGSCLLDKKVSCKRPHVKYPMLMIDFSETYPNLEQCIPEFIAAIPQECKKSVFLAEDVRRLLAQQAAEFREQLASVCQDTAAKPENCPTRFGKSEK